MRFRHLVLALIGTVVLSAAPDPVGAKKPDPQGPTGEERQLTPQEQAASDRKAAAAEAYVAAEASRGADLVSLACVVPLGAEPLQADAGGLAGTDAVAPTTGIEPLACAVPQGFIGVEARDQIFAHYCGPAVGQVIANYSWAMPAGANKYLQRDIAAWMSTDRNGQTDAFSMEAGLERATAGAPRRPAAWNWIVTELTDTDRDGWTGDQLHAFVRSNISNSRMPLAIPVKPHAANSPTDSNLASWPRPVESVGHWVAIYGWVGLYDGTDTPRMYYTDSSKDEGGATGKFWTATRRFAFLIREHTNRLVW
jgi:hypothetical protein